MDRIIVILQKKPPVFVIIALIYLALTALLKWQLQFSANFIWYLIGGVIGICFLDAAEVFFNLAPSPFRTTIFNWCFAIVSFFVVTSSGSFLGSGLVLSIFLNLLLWQIGKSQLNLVASLIIFILETWFFLR